MSEDGEDTCLRMKAGEDTEDAPRRIFGSQWNTFRLGKRDSHYEQLNRILVPDYSSCMGDLRT